MKKFLLTLAVMAFATSAMMAQTNATDKKVVAKKEVPQAIAQPKHECKDHKDGQPCTKPADQQCDDCKAKAAEGMKHECKEANGQKCEKEAMMKKHDECKKAEGMKHECKEGKGEKCEKEAMMKRHQDAKRLEGMKNHECKEGKGEKCEKEAMMKKHDECKKFEGMKHECNEAKGQKCEKEAMMKKHECKEGEGKQCDKPAMMKKHEECKDHKDGQPCTKPADQQCDDCKAAAAKKN